MNLTRLPLLGTLVLLLLAITIPQPSQAIDINGRCYPNPIILGVNEQGAQDANLIHNANLRWVRITLVWRVINPSYGAWDWGSTDALVNAHYNKGHKILGILSTAPVWAGSNSNGTTPPSNISYWEEFVRQVAIRYRGKIQAYEIWNEPDYDNHSVGVGWNKSLWTYPSYADYIRAAALKIRAHSPGALVVAPSLGSDPRAETVEVFRHLEEHPLPEGNASYFIDAVSVHANARSDESSSTVWSRLTSHLNTLSNRNPSNLGKPFWVTELGWKSNAVGEAGQEEKVRNLVTKMSYEWGLLDYPAYCGYMHRTTMGFIYKEIDDPGSSQGIHRMNSTPKPVVTQYLRALPTGGIFPPAGYNAEGYQPTSASCAGRTCTFTSGYAPSQWRVHDWDFGDGTTGTGHQVVHTYSRAGVYHVFHGTAGVLEWPTDTTVIQVN